MLTREEIERTLASDEPERVDWYDTPFVACDRPCFALKEPQTLEEYRAAYEHWKSHGYLSGCSHGC